MQLTIFVIDLQYTLPLMYIFDHGKDRSAVDGTPAHFHPTNFLLMHMQSKRNLLQSITRQFIDIKDLPSMADFALISVNHIKNKIKLLQFET